MNDLLRNYHDLVIRADQLCLRITGEFASQLSCRAGCDACCRHLSLFWVEAVALAVALRELPAEPAGKIRLLARGSSPDGPCPLLVDNSCLLYAVRPLICRTHGLPLIATADNGTRTIDFCPLNFQGLETLPGTAVIDADRLATALAAVNALFVSRYFHNSPPANERVTIAEALLMEL